MTRGAPPLPSAPLARQRVSEQVFDSLVQSILSGQLKPGETLATQRTLAKRFDVSPVLVRQAIHRLEELGLVRVRQGSTTVVLDPNTATDIRVLQLRVESATSDPRMVAAIIEVQALGALPMIVLAERCLNEDELQTLQKLSDSIREDATPEALHAFMVEYWLLVAHATRNPYFQHQSRWWWSLVEDLRRRGAQFPSPVHALAVRRDYQNLTRALAARQGALTTYLAAMQPLLSWLDFARPRTPGTNKPGSAPLKRRRMPKRAK